MRKEQKVRMLLQQSQARPPLVHVLYILMPYSELPSKYKDELMNPQ